MSGEIVLHEGAGITRVNVASDLPAIFTLAKALARAPGFIPAHLRNEGEIAAVILAGMELGLQPMVSLRSLVMIKGKVVLAADVQLALMVRAGARIKWVKDGSDGEAVLRVERPGQEPHESRFSLDMAKRAGLAGGDNWQKHPAAMMRARCVSSAGRAYMPDVLAGCYVPGELDDPPVDAEQRPTVATQASAEHRHETPAQASRSSSAPTVDIDEYGLAIPPSPCPIVRPGKRNAGKRWDELPGPLLEQMYSESGQLMSDVQREWAEYLLTKRQARKAREAAEALAAEQAAAESALGGETPQADAEAAP